MGYTETVIIDKIRTTYVLNNVYVVIDNINNGELVGIEIEIDVKSENEIEAANLEIQKIAPSIGLREEDKLKKTLTRLAIEKFTVLE